MNPPYIVSYLARVVGSPGDRVPKNQLAEGSELCKTFERSKHRMSIPPHPPHLLDILLFLLLLTELITAYRTEDSSGNIIVCRMYCN